MIAVLLALPAFVLGFIAPLPPTDLRGNNKTEVVYLDPLTVDLRCGGDLDPTNGFIVACHFYKTDVTILPNPCLYKDEPYARLACHELGHDNGWGPDHPDPHLD